MLYQVDRGRSWLEWSPHIQIRSSASYIYHWLLMRNFRFTSFKVISKIQIDSASRGDSTSLLLWILPPCPFFLSFFSCLKLSVFLVLCKFCIRDFGSSSWTLKVIKQAKGVGFSLLGFGQGKQTWHSFREEGLLTAPLGRRNILLTLFI